MLKVIIGMSKKIPLPGVEYSSQTASCTIEGEVSNGDPVATARELYRQAELAVDRQLKLQSNHPPQHSHQHGQGMQHDSGYPNQAHQSSQARTQAASYHSAPAQTNGSRKGRGMPQATGSQLKFINQLLRGKPEMVTGICQHYNVHDLAALTIKQASQVIDDLKEPVAGSA